MCYYATIMLPLNLYYAAINMACYYASVILLFKVYYAAINVKSILCCCCAAIMRLLLWYNPNILIMVK